MFYNLGHINLAELSIKPWYINLAKWSIKPEMLHAIRSHGKWSLWEHGTIPAEEGGGAELRIELSRVYLKRVRIRFLPVSCLLISGFSCRIIKDSRISSRLWSFSLYRIFVCCSAVALVTFFLCLSIECFTSASF